MRARLEKRRGQMREVRCEAVCVQDGETVLHVAAWSGRLDIIKYIIGKGLAVSELLMARSSKAVSIDCKYARISYDTAAAPSPPLRRAVRHPI